MKGMIIYCDSPTSRLKYVSEFIFREVMGMEVEIISSPDKLSGGELVISYSQREIPGAFFIFPSGLMEEKGVKTMDPGISWKNDIPFLFPTQNGYLDFDPFSAVFYLISRYEEYIVTERDHFNRFVASQSIAGKNGFLHLPVVNIWIRILAGKLAEFYPAFRVPEFKTAFIPTIDIDNPWAILHKPFNKKVGAILRDAIFFRLKSLSARIRVLRGVENDPFDSYDTFEDLHDSTLRIFFLMGNSGRRDNPLSPEVPAWRGLIRRLSEKFHPGIHPSFFTVEDPGLFRKEKEILQEITGKQIKSSRQHFLKLSLPETYRNLLAEGITEDYTMGYAEQAAFRAGTSFPFLFYDLEIEEPSPLRIFPFTVMDRTLKDYMKIDTKEAKLLISERISVIREYGGIFISVWHNESLGTHDEWQGWLEVYEYMLKEAKTLNL